MQRMLNKYAGDNLESLYKLNFTNKPCCQSLCCIFVLLEANIVDRKQQMEQISVHSSVFVSNIRVQ